MKRKRAAVVEEELDVWNTARTDSATGSSEAKARKQKVASKAPDISDAKRKPAWNEFRLFISGIPRDLDEDTVRKDFEECGDISNFALLRDKETGESRGLAFVTYYNEVGYKAALEMTEMIMAVSV